jgi:hypothetical protein
VGRERARTRGVHYTHQMMGEKMQTSHRRFLLRRIIGTKITIVDCDVPPATRSVCRPFALGVYQSGSLAYAAWLVRSNFAHYSSARNAWRACCCGLKIFTWPRAGYNQESKMRAGKKYGMFLSSRQCFTLMTGLFYWWSASCKISYAKIRAMLNYKVH